MKWDNLTCLPKINFRTSTQTNKNKFIDFINVVTGKVLIYNWSKRNFLEEIECSNKLDIGIKVMQFEPL